MPKHDEHSNPRSVLVLRQSKGLLQRALCSVLRNGRRNKVPVLLDLLGIVNALIDACDHVRQLVLEFLDQFLIRVLLLAQVLNLNNQELGRLKPAKTDLQNVLNDEEGNW